MSLRAQRGNLVALLNNYASGKFIHRTNFRLNQPMTGFPQRSGQFSFVSTPPLIAFPGRSHPVSIDIPRNKLICYIYILL